MILWVDRETCSEGHRMIPENRRLGRHAGQCLLCHRMRERHTYTKEAREWIPIITADPCCYCGKRGGTIDHILAKKSGGTDDWDNLTGACHSCNARKRTIPLLQFMLRQLPSSS
jgi:5-methylcytosine-specific restriction endonuclease McrA